MLLHFGEMGETDIVRLHFYAEHSSRSALADVGRKLCRHDCVAAGREGFTQCDVGRQSVACGTVTVAACQRLHDRLHPFALTPCGRMVIIDAGQYIFQRKGIVNDAVCRIAEAHGQIGRREVSKEGQHQRGKRTFLASCPSDQREKKLRLMTDLAEKFVQRREKDQRQARIDYLARREVMREHAG